MPLATSFVMYFLVTDVSCMINYHKQINIPADHWQIHAWGTHKFHVLISSENSLQNI